MKNNVSRKKKKKILNTYTQCANAPAGSNPSEPLPTLLIYAFDLLAVNRHKDWRTVWFPEENIFC